MVVAAIVAMDPALKAAIHPGLQIKSRRKALHRDVTRFAAIELEGQIGRINCLPERIVSPFDLVVDRGDLAARYGSIRLTREFRSRQIMRLARSPLFKKDRQGGTVELKH